MVELYKIGQVTFEVTKPSLKERFNRWIEEMYDVKNNESDIKIARINRF